MTADTETIVIQAADQVNARLPEPHTETFFPTVADRLDEVMRERLNELYGIL